MNKWIPLVALAFLLAFNTQDARAQFSLGARGSYNLDTFSEDGAAEGAYSLGAEARFGIAGLPLVINPGIDYYFTGIENVNALQFDANALVPFGTNNAVFTPYAGAGLAVTRVSYEPNNPVLGNLLEEEQTDVGVNLIGGAVFGSGAVRPFAQARITLGKHQAFVNEDGEGGPGYGLMAGVLFRIGQ